MHIQYTHALGRKLRHWFWRYLPFEIIATFTSLSGAAITYFVSDSLVAAAVAGTVCENIGYYGAATYREVRHYYQIHHTHPRLKRVLFTASHSLRGMLIEFGPAEVVDSLFVRPYLMYIMPQILHNNPLGWLSGKVLADVVFYSIAGCCYELRQLPLAKLDLGVFSRKKD